jgi:hypothetical protein
VKLYKTYNCVAITFLVAVSGFMCVLMLGSDPQGAEPEEADSWVLPSAVTDPTLTDDLQVAQADETEIQGTLNDPFASTTMDIQEQDLSVGTSPVEFSTDNSGDSVPLASAVEVDPGSGINSDPIGSSASGSNYATGSGLGRVLNSGTGGSSGTGGGSAGGTTNGVAGDGTSGGGNGTGGGSRTGGGTGTGGGGSTIIDPTGGTGSTDGSSGDSNSNGNNGGVAQEDFILPEWIDKEGIRAGYLYYYSDLQYVQEMKDIGLNTVVVKVWEFDQEHFSYTLSQLRKWDQLCQQAGMHLFVVFNWQPQAEVLSQCRPVVFADGTDGVFACPLDDTLWLEHLTPNAFAVIGAVVPYVEGLLFDMEMYGTEELPGAKRNYSTSTCFCDSCFSSYLSFRHLDGSGTLIAKPNRRNWLSGTGRLSDYFAYQEEKLEAKADYLRTRVRSLSSTLLFGVYPHPEEGNWVRNSVARSLGRDSYPIVVFGTHSYYIGGIDSVPIDTTAYLAALNINGVYVSGYLFRKYTSDQIGSNITQACLRDKGYWLYRIPQLYKAELVDPMEMLAGGTQAAYRQAILNANITLDTRLHLE